MKMTEDTKTKLSDAKNKRFMARWRPTQDHDEANKARILSVADQCRILSAQGYREPAIRAHLGLTTAQWKKEKRKPSVHDALQLGRAELQSEVIAFMLEKMRKGSESAAKWLGERVLGLAEPVKEQAAVNVVIVNAMSVKEYLAL